MTSVVWCVCVRGHTGVCSPNTKAETLVTPRRSRCDPRQAVMSVPSSLEWTPRFPPLKIHLGGGRSTRFLIIVHAGHWDPTPDEGARCERGNCWKWLSGKPGL